MRITGPNRLAGLLALTAFAVYSAGALADPPDFGTQQPSDAWHLWLLSPELLAGQVPDLDVELHRVEAPRPLGDSLQTTAHTSRGPPA